VPEVTDPDMPTRPLLDFKAGYVLRALDRFPRQGEQAPWQVLMSYAQDAKSLRGGEIEDGALRFSRRRSAARAATPVGAARESLRRSRRNRVLRSSPARSTRASRTRPCRPFAARAGGEGRHAQDVVRSCTAAMPAEPLAVLALRTPIRTVRPRTCSADREDVVSSATQPWLPKAGAAAASTVPAASLNDRRRQRAAEQVTYTCTDADLAPSVPSSKPTVAEPLTWPV
jgi:hypothetical protein